MEISSGSKITKPISLGPAVNFWQSQERTKFSLLMTMKEDVEYLSTYFTQGETLKRLIIP